MGDISTDDLDDQWVAAKEEGAAEERARIRREVMGSVRAVRADHYATWCDCVLCVLTRAIDAATRAPRRRGRGK